MIVALLTSAISVCLPLQNFSVNPPQAVETAQAFSARMLVRGSAGADVSELQRRLSQIGFYKGRIDQVFGWQTYWSVRNFQSKFGLKVDGRVGASTRAKLIAATPNYAAHSNGGHSAGSSAPSPARSQSRWRTQGTRQSNPVPVRNVSVSSTGQLSAYDMRLVANAVNGESRGEPFEGQVAVAAVILNRLRSPLFPHSIPAIIFQPGAFTAVQDGQIYLTPTPTSFRAVTEAVNGSDPSDGAIYYFNPATATSKWIWSRPQIKHIAHHIFCR
ncbi:MAG: sleB [Bacilli bacterium]|nr:sleB [Bacilli bacterium]